MATISARLKAAAATDCWSRPTRRAGRSSSWRAGFTRMPSARTQAASSVATEEGTSTPGPASSRRRRQRQPGPGRRHRARVAGRGQPADRPLPPDFAPGAPETNAAYAAAFVRGTLAAGIAPTVKHFPGLGRITGNTDVTSSGIPDRTTDAADPYLAPFGAGIGRAPRWSWSPPRATPSSTRATRRCSPRP